MTTSLSASIDQKQQTRLSGLLGSQTFWVFIAVIVASLVLSFVTDSFATQKNLYNITRNVTFVAIIALGMTMVIITGGIDLSVGSVLCLCSMVLAVVMHAGYSIEVGIARIDRHGSCRRRNQRRPDRLYRPATLRGDARHAVDRAQPCDGRLGQHRGVRVRTRSRYPAGARGRGMVLRDRQSGDVHDRPRPADRLRPALDALRPLSLRHRRQRAGGDPDRRAGADDQGRGLHDLGPDGRHRRASCRPAGLARSPPTSARGWNCR